MIVLFNEDNREYLRVFAEETEEQKQSGIEIKEEDIPHKEGHRTVIYKKNDKEVEYKFEERIEEKSEVEELKSKLEEQEERITTLSQALNEVILGQAEDLDI